MARGVVKCDLYRIAHSNPDQLLSKEEWADKLSLLAIKGETATFSPRFNIWRTDESHVVVPKQYIRLIKEVEPEPEPEPKPE